jgi:hypothetical protein
MNGLKPGEVFRNLPYYALTPALSQGEREHKNALTPTLSQGERESNAPTPGS